jgi:hypothetical protein
LKSKFKNLRVLSNRNLENLYEKEREKINQKLKTLENQKFFRSEIEIREVDFAFLGH